jgi:hypothetical protein
MFKKKTFEGIKPHFMQHISIHILVMVDPPFFLAVNSQPLGPRGHTIFCTSALLLFQSAVKLILLNLILS